MKRILLISVGIGLLVFGCLVGVGIWWYPRQPPISYEEMARLQEDPDRAAAEIPRLLKCFDINDEDVRVQAALTLKVAGARAVDPLRARLQDRNPNVRFCAVEALAWIGAEAAPAADDIQPFLKDDHVLMRYKAAYALGRLGVTSDAVIAGLVGALEDPNVVVSNTAREALARLGPAAAPRLYQLLPETNERVRPQLLSLLAPLGAPPLAALPTLTALVRDPSFEVRGKVWNLLARMGQPAVPLFREALQDHAALDSLALIPALVQLGPEARPLLGELQEEVTRNLVVNEERALIGVFAQCGAEGAQGLADVLRTLHKKPRPGLHLPDERYPLILKALAGMGPAAKVAVPALVDLMTAQPLLRGQILETLGDIGPAAGEAIPAVEALRQEPRLADIARTTLRRMGVVDPK